MALAPGHVGGLKRAVLDVLDLGAKLGGCHEVWSRKGLVPSFIFQT